MARSEIRAAIQRARAGEVEEAARALASEKDLEVVRQHLTRLAHSNAPLASALLARVFPNAPVPEGAAGEALTTTASDGQLHAALPPKVELANPGPFLTLVSREHLESVSLTDSFVLQAWGIVGLAALARVGRETPLVVDADALSNGARFAHGIGLMDVIVGNKSPEWGEPGRTVRARRLREMTELEPVAAKISSLIAPQHDVVQKTLYYVLVELLRNALQHSLDPLGAVVGAQLMTEAQHYERPAVQVVVADAGIGIFAALKGMHPELTDAASAIEKALRPHISGTFEEGLTGSERNAGFGLFVISELTKLTGGRLLIASRDAALQIRADVRDDARHVANLVGPPGTGFPGTLVAFEIPLTNRADFAQLMEAIKERARIQTPQRNVHRWIRYDQPPTDANFILVRVSVENTDKAAQVAKAISRQIIAGEPIVLDFAGLGFVTQSFLHALLFKPLRLAWAEQQGVHVVNAEPAVRSALETFEHYALSG